jgi:hypothetical protein
VQQRHALGLLFLFLAACFAGIAVAAARAGVWVITLAGATLGAWLAQTAIRALRRR